MRRNAARKRARGPPHSYIRGGLERDQIWPHADTIDALGIKGRAIHRYSWRRLRRKWQFGIALWLAVQPFISRPVVIYGGGSSVGYLVEV